MDNTNRELSIPFKIMIALIMAFVYAALNILLADFSLVEVPYVCLLYTSKMRAVPDFFHNHFVFLSHKTRFAVLFRKVKLD